MAPLSPVVARPLDAASLLVLRDAPSGPQVFMVRRHPGNRFMANALVFVGGRFDEADAAPEALACCTGLSPGQASQRLGMPAADGARALGLHVTAIRECFEECGLLLARGPAGEEPPAAADLARLRGELLEGRLSLAQLCHAHRLLLPVGELRFFDHWITPEVEPRRFDTRFFVARAPAGQTASFDPRETTFGDWFAPAEVLRANGEQRELLAPPTLAILERITAFSSVDELLALPEGPVSVTQPRLLPGSMPPVLLLPGDHRFENFASTAGGPQHYVFLENGRWKRVTSG